MVIAMARGSGGTFQRVLPFIREFLNTTYGWNLPAGMMSCLLTMMSGAKVDMNKLSTQYGIEKKIAKCFSAIMLARLVPVAQITSDASNKNETKTKSMFQKPKSSGGSSSVQDLGRKEPTQAFNNVEGLEGLPPSDNSDVEEDYVIHEETEEEDDPEV
jgi:hypothetical protein